ncbi:MAG: hemolysin III family protein [Promethearchaeota archaeon]
MSNEPGNILDRNSAIVNFIGLLLYLFIWVIFIIRIASVVTSLPESADVFRVVFTTVVYSVGVWIFWPIQISYHLRMMKGKKSPGLQRIDRASLLFLIASMFMPILQQFTPFPVNVIIMIFTWIMAFSGLMLLLLVKNLSRKLAPLLAFGSGLTGIITIVLNITTMPIEAIILFISGVGFFLGGGAVYVIKKPDLKEGTFGFHELFHALVVVAIICFHFIVEIALT